MAEEFRLVFSDRMFADIKANDARAAVRAWSLAVARERGIEVSPDTGILSGLDRLIDAFRRREADAAAMLVDEYVPLARVVPASDLLVGVMGGSIEEEYVLLVHVDSGLESVAGLRGRTLVHHENPRTCLALPWLETLMHDTGLGPADRFYSKLTPVRRVAGVVLPVFFRKADACLTTRRAWKMMAELNPQVGQRLKPLATSPAIVPVVMFLHADYLPADKARLLEALRRLEESPAGQQVLTIFQIERLEEHPTTCLDSSRKVLEAYETLRASRPTGGAPPGLPGGGAGAGVRTGLESPAK